MAGSKVKSVQETLIYMISNLGEADVFGLVGFHTEVCTAGSLYRLYIGIADGMVRCAGTGVPVLKMIASEPTHRTMPSAMPI